MHISVNAINKLAFFASFEECYKNWIKKISGSDKAIKILLQIENMVSNLFRDVENKK